MKFFQKLFSKEPVNEREIITMVNAGHEQGVLEASEAEMISNIFAFGDKDAHDIMTHRENIVGLEAHTTLQDAVSFMLGSKNSRFPVFDESIDNIIGLLHFKDAVKANMKSDQRGKTLREVEGLIMEARFIPETRKIDVLFRTMQQNKIHMVIVVDEYGQTAGLIAMEDILEEIVGNILDEYDEDENNIRAQGDDSFVISGTAPLSEVGERLGISFEDEDYETLNGFMTDRLGHVPKTGEDFEVEYRGYRFRIAYVKGRVIRTVRAQKT
ncbi:MAG: hemolysin family protein [Lachnospiraceae bacterium]|nr:hemolysin family protein [Lachnospiraceae bacterium]